MKTFTGFQYLLIDAANQFGLDKLNFEERLNWAEEHLNQLEQLAYNREPWKERPLYLKAVMAIRDAQQGIPSGHMVGFDAVCSGLQIMSAAMGCLSGAKATGLVDPEQRADAYSELSELMSDILGRVLPNLRADAKQALMTYLYGSKEEPKKIFGEDTEELEAFKKAAFALAPGACELLQILIDSWNPYATAHQWTLPDGHLAYVPVKKTVEFRPKIEELGNISITYQYKEICGEKRGVKNAANVIHSIDAYVLRTLIRRCSYDAEQVKWAFNAFTDELLEREMGLVSQGDRYGLGAEDEALQACLENYRRSQLADLTILDHLYAETVCLLDSEHLRALNRQLSQLLEHKPFPVITVHDEFKCHPNNMNHLRNHYRQILADLSDSKVIADIVSQLYGAEVDHQLKEPQLPELIRQSNYALT